VFGAFNLNKDGTGLMTLSASNSFTGIAHVLNGTLAVDDDFALGTLGGDRQPSLAAHRAVRFSAVGNDC